MREDVVTEKGLLRFLQERRAFERRAGEVASLYRGYVVGDAERIEFSILLGEVTAYWYESEFGSTFEECESFPIPDLWTSDEEITQRLEKERDESESLTP